jgi:hypothetical protein
MSTYKNYKSIKDPWRWVNPGIIFFTCVVGGPLILGELYALVAVLFPSMIVLSIVLGILDRKLPRHSSCGKKMERQDAKHRANDTVHYCDECKEKIVLSGMNYE